MKEVNDDLNKWEKPNVHLQEDSILLRGQFLPNWSIDSTQFQSFQQVTLWILTNLSPNFIWKPKRSSIANTALKGKNQVGRLTLPDFKTYSKVTVINTVE